MSCWARGAGLGSKGSSSRLAARRGGIFIGGELVPEHEIARLQEQIKTLFNDMNDLKNDVREIKNQLANRLPLWATVIMSLLTGAIGWLLSGGG